ncbi:MAG: GGDEF domain-containing protein, partial [Rhizobiaceae bacterium]|nr:GGDEF domain-containing protein [Rhizobiaceae bacterium]
MNDSMLLIAQAAFYFGVMAGLFRLRARFGIGLFLCALGVMHFLETYLASVFYVETPFGLVSPGSAVLFSGKLVMLLLLYIKEDAAAVRQPIYGLLLGNALMVGFVLFLRQHEVALLPDGRTPDLAFIDEMGWLMVWGTSLLFVDSILLILFYEKLRRGLHRIPYLRLAVAVCGVLTFDHAGFYAALRLLNDAPLVVFFGGWAAKMVAGLFFSAALLFYLRWFEAPQALPKRPLRDIFEVLTYRERYEALIANAGRDSLTGLLDKGRFESVGERTVATVLDTGRPLSLLIVDVDHFKSINDRFGHIEGDRALRFIADVLGSVVDADHHVFRIGGEEFAVLAEIPHPMARLLGERIRQTVSSASAGRSYRMTVSIGVATLRKSTDGITGLFALADQRLYVAKSGGRDRVIGEVSRSQPPVDIA